MRTLPGEGSFNKTTLANGLRVVTEKIPSVRSVSLGVWIETGSRHETLEENGISHLIEHMVFKGTRSRNAREIATELESVGGSINAFTSRENTCYNARVIDSHLDKAVDVLADLTCNARITPVNLKREKMVILEEIKESFDNPGDRIHDIFAESYWGGHPLGRPILGTAENVINFPRKKVVEYIKQQYRTGSVVVAAAGNISHRKLVRLVKEKFSLEPGKAKPALPAERKSGKIIRCVKGKNAQTHVCLGFPGPAYAYPNKMAALMVNTYLGSGMSCVMFQKVREEKGLVYSVYTYQDYYRDAGIFGVYLGTDKKHVALAVEIVLRELDRMKKHRLPSLKMYKLKEQLRGQLALGMESTTARMSRIARYELYLGQYRSFNKTLSEINKITSSNILEYTNQTFDRPSIVIATLGPVDRKELEKVV